MQKSFQARHLRILRFCGYVTGNIVRAFAYILTNKIEGKEFKNQLVFIGYESLSMIIVLTAIASMILTVNTAIELTNHGGRELIGALISVADLREIIPIFIAFAIAARCGTATTAEIATMKVTDQIDVLRVIKVDPVYFLLVPRLLAAMLLSPLLLAIAAFVGMIAGMLVSKVAVNLEYTQFLDSAWKVVDLKEYFYPLIKTEIFAIYSIAVNVSMGLDCSGGAKEVGLATTKATAFVIVGIIVIDSILTPILYI
jgi:phospholipid/cholesterol/gamma-HCH transport system permease protein